MTSGEPRLIDAALSYARRRWPVLPLHAPDDGGRCSCGRDCPSPGKHPRTAHGLQDATTDEATIRGWWRTWPQANLGIATGTTSGLVVIDLDGESGRNAWYALEAEHGDCLPTMTARTGRGYHLLLRHPGVPVKSRAGVAGHVGIDVRGDGGYIVAPPSRHASGSLYKWEAGPDEIDPQLLPRWLLTVLTDAATGDAQDARVDTDGRAISEGVRNATLTSLAGAMRRRGATSQAIEVALLQENAVCCVPPLPDSEVRAIARSVGRYEPGEPPTDVTQLLHVTGLDAFGENAPLADVGAALAALAKLLKGAPPLLRSLAREGAIRALTRAGLRSPAAVVDAALSANEREKPPDLQGAAPMLTDPEPWPVPVNLADLLNDLVLDAFSRYARLPRGGAVALALWTLHAHSHEAAAVSPLLVLKSPVKRSGKTTVLTILGALVPRPLMSSNVTPAALFRSVEKCKPTLLVDEADSFMRENDELRGLLNSGHTRAGAVVVRAVGDEHEVRTFSTWGAKAVALIGPLPTTLEDRAIVLTMRRRARSEKVARLRLDRLHELEPLRRRAFRWAADNLERLRGADPDVPEELHDRAADNWRVLFAVADLAGGCWPYDARAAALSLSAGIDEGDTAPAIQLLADLRDLFRQRTVDRLASKEIVDVLVSMTERPWPEWGRGRPLTEAQLARLLKPFDVRPKQFWIAGAKVRGYAAADLQDAWLRYCPPFNPVDPVEPAPDVA